MKKEECQAKDKHFKAVEDLKLRQAMGGGAVCSNKELPGARIPISQTVEWLGGIDRFQNMNRTQMENVFKFLSKTGLRLNPELNDSISLCGRTRNLGANETVKEMRLRLAKALTPKDHQLPNWAIDIQTELYREEHHAGLVRNIAKNIATQNQEYQRDELYSPNAFNNTRKRVLEATQSYELSDSPTLKKLRTKGSNSILCPPTGTFSNDDVKPNYQNKLETRIGKI